nr:hypothetical protein [uncultured Bacteroides sp.]
MRNASFIPSFTRCSVTVHSSAASLIISSVRILRNGLPVMPTAIHSSRADFPAPFDCWESLSRLSPKIRVVTP